MLRKEFALAFDVGDSIHFSLFHFNFENEDENEDEDEKEGKDFKSNNSVTTHFLSCARFRFRRSVWR